MAIIIKLFIMEWAVIE